MLVAGLDGVDTEGGWGCGGEVGFVVRGGVCGGDCFRSGPRMNPDYLCTLTFDLGDEA